MIVRNYGIDLLRIISMLMICTLHVLGHGGILQSVNYLSLNYEIAWFLEISCYCAVNCYALISGYVGVNTNFRCSNILKLWLKVLFYSINITICFYIFSNFSVDKKEIINSLFPIITSKYWYFTAYIGFCFFIPFLNHLIKSLQKKQAINIVFIILVLFSVLPTIIQNDIWHTSYGYSPLWLAFLYIVGGCIKKHGIFNNLKKSTIIISFISCIILTWGCKYLIEHSNLPIDGNILVTYTSPTILFAGISLILLFAKIKINIHAKKIISLLAPLSFSVYLIHDNNLIREYLINMKFANYITYNPLKFILSIFGTIFFIYSICTIIDIFRYILFKFLKINNVCKYIDKIINGGSLTNSVDDIQKQ